MSLSFRTNGNFIDFVNTDATSLNVETVLMKLHNTSRCIDWSLPEDTTKISFTIDEVKYSNIPITEIDFDGTVMNSQDDFETGITAMFPGLDSSGEGDSGGGVESVTYAALVALINASGLIAGQQYLISDFATKHYIVDAGGDQYLDSIITGDLEPLIVTAVAVNKLDKVAKSTVFPQDIIHVDFDENNWLDDLSFADVTTDDENPVIVTGWKGTIYFRHDTLLDNYMGYDFRNCKFRRWKTDVADYDSGTSYNSGQAVKFNDRVYISTKNSNTNNEPIFNSAFWTMTLNLTLTEYWNNVPGNQNNIISDPDEFEDFKTFVEGIGTATYDVCVMGNHFGSFRDRSIYYDANATILANNVFFLYDAEYYTIFANEIGMESYGNTVVGDFDNNILGTIFSNNQICGQFEEIIAEHSVSDNIFGRSCGNCNFGTAFSGNITGFQFTNNKISTAVQSNIFGNQVAHNVIGSDFTSNQISTGFKQNTIASNVSSIYFGDATHVYADYSCEISKSNEGTFKLKYLDDDVLIVVAANA